MPEQHESNQEPSSERADVQDESGTPDDQIKRWRLVPSSEIGKLHEIPADPDWAAEVEEQRAEDFVTDPWADETEYLLSSTANAESLARAIKQLESGSGQVHDIS